MVNKKRRITFFEFLIVSALICLCDLSCSVSHIRKYSSKEIDICERCCYGEYVIATNDTLKGFFMIRKDSIFLATQRRLNDLKRFYPSALQIAMYYIGSTKLINDTIELKRNSKDISIVDEDELNFQTYIFPKVAIDEFHFTIRHATISKSPSYRRTDRIFYYTEGRVCPDSIVNISKEASYIFMYD